MSQSGALVENAVIVEPIAAYNVVAASGNALHA
jgi:hypothetical protein